ncbi:Geminin coiled-coil domain-containing protein 1 [Bagarius yarrelli]|uniref:Geminin coiled-coil domain-containing protein 1 n=1 Tax=Bagarius yarrelli TaxID=175774 RepID=A0A556V794_BAGYA|nr:Geminin coiled-coil domain-containing protein 1 [Bagarius yarrelli]
MTSRACSGFVGQQPASTGTLQPIPPSSILSCRDARFDCAYSALTSARATVDVSTATLVSLWDAGRLDDAGRPRELPQPVPAHGGLQDSVWSDQLSPHLQRNKQEENNKLKEFLNSSYVKSLEVKSKRLFSVQRSSDVRHRKRALHDERDYLNVSRLLQGSEGKRTCRNLSLEFCSADEVATTPPLDSWVLETLGLQDEDTINTDSSFSSPTTEHTTSFGSPTPSTEHFSPIPLQDRSVYSPYSDSQCEYSGSVEASCSFRHSMDGSTDYLTSRMYTVTSTGSLQGIEAAAEHFAPPKAASTPQRPQAPSAEPQRHRFSTPQKDESAPFVTRSRTDLAFSMSLSPQNSVKTHTFPQGQAFTRRHSQENKRMVEGRKVAGLRRVSLPDLPYGSEMGRIPPGGDLKRDGNNRPRSSNQDRPGSPETSTDGPEKEVNQGPQQQTTKGARDHASIVSPFLVFIAVTLGELLANPVTYKIQDGKQIAD